MDAKDLKIQQLEELLEARASEIIFLQGAVSRLSESPVTGGEDDLMTKALEKYCSPYGKANPETYAYVQGLKDAGAVVGMEVKIREYFKKNPIEDCGLDVSDLTEYLSTLPTGNAEEATSTAEGKKVKRICSFTNKECEQTLLQCNTTCYLKSQSIYPTPTVMGPSGPVMYTREQMLSFSTYMEALYAEHLEGQREYLNKGLNEHLDNWLSLSPQPVSEAVPTDEQIERFVLKVMEQDPKKAASWMTLVTGRECVKANAAEMVIKLDADMPDGKRYNIVNTISVSEGKGEKAIKKETHYCRHCDFSCTDEHDMLMHESRQHQIYR